MGEAKRPDSRDELVPCPGPGVWVEPAVFCAVRFLEWTRQGYLRGVSNLRRPLEIVVISNVANLVLEVVFVYGFIAWTFYLSFTNSKAFSSTTLVGLANYQKLWTWTFETDPPSGWYTAIVNMGLFGGLLPAVRAARLPIAEATKG